MPDEPIGLARVVPARVESNTAVPLNGMLRACSWGGCGQGVLSLLSGQLQWGPCWLP